MIRKGGATTSPRRGPWICKPARQRPAAALPSSPAAISLGGVLNIDSPGSISGAGSVFDLATSSNPGVVTRSTAVTGTVSAPDSFGAVQINLASDFSASAIQFTAYPVDSTHMQLIESDASSGSGFAETAGMAIGQ